MRKNITEQFKDLVILLIDNKLIETESTNNRDIEDVSMAILYLVQKI